MDVLEEQQRDRAAALEETVVARLDVQQVALAELVEQRREVVAQRFRQFAGADQRMQAEALLAQLGAWIVEQQGEQAEQLAVIVHGAHSWICTTWITSRRLVGLPPNRLTAELLPPEQPLPKLKPQPERSAKASESASSRCALGITKRSS